MKPPISYVYGNCVFARGFDDRWAGVHARAVVLRVAGRMGKHARSLALVGVLESIEADVQLVRVYKPPVGGGALRR